MSDLEQEIERDRQHTVRIIQKFTKISPHHPTRCVCDGIATVLFTETMGSITLERRLFCDYCNPFTFLDSAVGELRVESGN